MQIRITLFWIVLGLLAAFVVFVHYIADVGGSHEPLGVPPPPIETPLPSPPPGAGLPLEAGLTLLELEHQVRIVVADERALLVIRDPGLLGAAA